MKIEAYILCIKRAAITFTTVLVKIISILFLALFPVEICYSIYGMNGIGIGLLISVLLCIFIAIIDHEITEYKRWNDD